MDANPIENGQPMTPSDNADTTPPSTLTAWFRQNAVQLAVVVAAIIAICSFLHPMDVLLAGFGLSLIIFIHELGHFAAAKLCDVHVKTFSIGFGPALPFCQFQYGETTYKLAMIPLGGFVAMVGEGDEQGDTVEGEEDPERAAADPRSFRNKSVGARMLIISAGVIMNVLLGAVCFVVTYLHGVEEAPAIASAIEPGSAAWRTGIRPGAEITRINDRENPWFDDLKPAVMSTRKGETVSLEVAYRGDRESVVVEPIRQEGALFPQLGIAPPLQLTLRSFRRDEMPPYDPGSPAALAKAPDGGAGFRPGDRIVAMSDPDNPERVTPIEANWNKLPGEYFDYNRRLERLTDRPITFHVVRRNDSSGTPVPVLVAPNYRQDLGLRMRMGEVTAIRRNSAAEKAGIQARQTDGDKVIAPGDQIVAVAVTEPDGTVTRFTSDKTEAAGSPTTRIKPLDPSRLPFELNRWADRNPSDRVVRVTVLREGEHTRKPVTLALEWDPAYREEVVVLAHPGSPTPIGGLGLAYHIQTVVETVEPFAAAERARLLPSAAAFGAAAFAARAEPSPAAKAGLQPNDRVAEVRFKARDHSGKDVTGNWDEVRLHQWAYVDYTLQNQYPHSLDLRIERGGQTQEVSLTATEDPSWALPSRGLILSPERRTQKAEGIGEALQMGVDRTARSIKTVYLGLYSMVFGRISVKTMSGPIGLARVSYILAGEDVWHLLIWMGLISINLAVVNFLPIPVLDGGHMVFLLYEWIRGKPAPISIQAALTYLGLAIVLGMMVFVIGLDIWRLFFA